MSLVLNLTGNNFLIVVFVLMALNGIFCFAKKPILGIPLGFISWIVFFAFSISLDVFSFILIIITLIIASASIITNIVEIKS